MKKRRNDFKVYSRSTCSLLKCLFLKLFLNECLYRKHYFYLDSRSRGTFGYTTPIISSKPTTKADTTQTGVVCGAHCGV